MGSLHGGGQKRGLPLTLHSPSLQEKKRRSEKLHFWHQFSEMARARSAPHPTPSQFAQFAKNALHTPNLQEQTYTLPMCKKRKGIQENYIFRHQLDEMSSSIPGCSENFQFAKCLVSCRCHVTCISVGPSGGVKTQPGTRDVLMGHEMPPPVVICCVMR